MDTPAPQPETPFRACGTCDFWEPPDQDEHLGWCHRYAPRDIDVFARTGSSQWCGDYLSKDTRMATEGQALATVKGIAHELQTAGKALEAAAEELKAKGCGMGANKAWAAKKRAYEVAGGYL